MGPSSVSASSGSVCIAESTYGARRSGDDTEEVPGPDSLRTPTTIVPGEIADGGERECQPTAVSTCTDLPPVMELAPPSGPGCVEGPLVRFFFRP